MFTTMYPPSLTGLEVDKIENGDFQMPKIRLKKKKKDVRRNIEKVVKLWKSILSEGTSTSSQPPFQTVSNCIKICCLFSVPKFSMKKQ